jgi:hypothetical protein
VTILFFGSVLLGAVFGRFFKVWILVPACVVAFVAVFASSAYYGPSFLDMILEFAMLTACLQIGYASGLLSNIIPGIGRRLGNPRQSSRPVASMAATRQR